jgi:hypothetical protein
MTVEQQTDDTALDFLLALHRLVRSLRRSAAGPGLHPTQLLVLVHLAEAGPARIGELATRVSCSQPTATTVTNGLETAASRTRPTGGRSRYSSPNPAGTPCAPSRGTRPVSSGSGWTNSTSPTARSCWPRCRCCAG